MRKYMDIINEERVCQTPGAIYNTTISDHTVKAEVTLPDEVEVGEMTDKQGDKFDDMIHDAMEKIVAKIIDTTQPNAYDLWKQAREADPVKESAELTKRLIDLYTTADLYDETENLGRYAEEWGNSFWQKVCKFPFPIREISAEYAVTHWTTNGRKIKAAYRNATKQQKQIVSSKISKFDNNRVVVLDGNNIVDGNHHIIAALKADQPIKYINFSDLPDSL